MRTLGTNLTADIEARITSQLYLVYLGTSTPQYIATGTDVSNSAIVWDSQTWQPRNFNVSDGQIAGAQVSYSITFSALDTTFLATLSETTSDTDIRIYQTAKLASYSGADDVVLMLSGKVRGGYELAGGYLSMLAYTSSDYYGWRVNDVNGFTQITPPGRYQFGNNIIVLKREQA